MNQEKLKQAVAEKALEYVAKESLIGIGSGSTVNCFIDALANSNLRHQIETVASSLETERRLKALGISVVDLNAVGTVPVYVDGADEFNAQLKLIKGGGGALTREKIIANSAKKFIGIVDLSKQVKVLGRFPVAVEVIPMARGLVARELLKLGGKPEYREGFISDNGGCILDVYGLDLVNPIEMEQKINNMVGVICNGIFAKRGADIILMSTPTGIEKISA